MRVVPTDDDIRPWVRTQAGDAALDAAIEEYKAALVPETTALDGLIPAPTWTVHLRSRTATARRVGKGTVKGS
jgi:hypothetical protein